MAVKPEFEKFCGDSYSTEFTHPTMRENVVNNLDLLEVYLMNLGMDFPALSHLVVSKEPNRPANGATTLLSFEY